MPLVHGARAGLMGFMQRPSPSKRVFWFGSKDLTSAGSGGAAYSGAVYRLLRAVRPDWELVEVTPRSEDRPAGLRSHRVRQGVSLLSSLFGGLPAIVRFGQSPVLAARRDVALSAGVPDLVFLDGPDMYPLAAPLLEHGVPFLLLVHNIEHELFAARLDRLPPPALWAMRLLGEPHRYAAFERRVWEGAAGFIHISKDEMQDMPVARPAVFVPPLFEPGPPRRAQRRPGPLRLGFVGKLTWWPNRLGLEWLLSQVWPTASSEIELHLWGIGSEDFNAPGKRVFGHGFVPDLDETWSSVDVMLVPAKVSGGVNVKLCEAVARGVPVLATSLALRGLPSIEDPAVRVGDDPKDWIAAMEPRQLRELADSKPGEAIRSLFDPSAAVPPFSDFLARLGK